MSKSLDLQLVDVVLEAVDFAAVQVPRDDIINVPLGTSIRERVARISDETFFWISTLLLNRGWQSVEFLRNGTAVLVARALSHEQLLGLAEVQIDEIFRRRILRAEFDNLDGPELALVEEDGDEAVPDLDLTLIHEIKKAANTAIRTAEGTGSRVEVKLENTLANRIARSKRATFRWLADTFLQEGFEYVELLRNGRRLILDKNLPPAQFEHHLTDTRPEVYSRLKIKKDHSNIGDWRRLRDERSEPVLCGAEMIALRTATKDSA